MVRPISKIQEFMDKVLAVKPEIRVLEAGCGSANHFHFGQRVHVTGIDISKKQLERNLGLHERILGDIQYYESPSSSFDVIVCWNVLEHLQQPELALDQFRKAIKQDGIVVLGLPNLWSLKGLMTKYLPHAFHVWVYKYVYRISDIRKEDIGPFKTYLRPTVAPNAIKKFAALHELKVIYFDTYDVLDLPNFRNTKMGLLASTIYRAIKLFGEWVTLGRLGNSELIIVLQKQSDSFVPSPRLTTGN